MNAFLCYSQYDVKITICKCTLRSMNLTDTKFQKWLFNRSYKKYNLLKKKYEKCIYSGNEIESASKKVLLDATFAVPNRNDVVLKYKIFKNSIIILYQKISWNETFFIKYFGYITHFCIWMFNIVLKNFKISEHDVKTFFPIFFFFFEFKHKSMKNMNKLWVSKYKSFTYNQECKC